MANLVKHIDAAALTTFEVDADGARVHFHVRTLDGSPAELTLPAACLAQLLMTLPKMMREALRNSRGDDSLRVVYPLDRYKIELAEPNSEGGQQFILTLASGGFGVSFASPAEALADIARSILGNISTYPETEHHSPRLS